MSTAVHLPLIAPPEGSTHTFSSRGSSMHTSISNMACRRTTPLPASPYRLIPRPFALREESRTPALLIIFQAPPGCGVPHACHLSRRSMARLLSTSTPVPIHPLQGAVSAAKSLEPIVSRLSIRVHNTPLPHQHTRTYAFPTGSCVRRRKSST